VISTPTDSSTARISASFSADAPLGLADRVPRNTASTHRNLTAVPAKQLPSLPDLVTSDHRWLRHLQRPLARPRVALFNRGAGVSGSDWFATARLRVG
jgi:hypothetical protein